MNINELVIAMSKEIKKSIEIERKVKNDSFYNWHDTQVGETNGLLKAMEIISSLDREDV